MLNRPAYPMAKVGPVALWWAESPFFSYCSFTICGGLVWQATRTAQCVQAQCTVA
jgi:hypothetical protein